MFSNIHLFYHIPRSFVVWYKCLDYQYGPCTEKYFHSYAVVPWPVASLPLDLEDLFETWQKCGDRHRQEVMLTIPAIDVWGGEEGPE